MAQKIPSIRFPGFTEPWEQRKLGDIVDVCSGRDYKHLSEGPIPVYGTGGYMTNVSEALEHKRDAVGIGRKGTIDSPYVLRAPFWTVDTLFYCPPKDDVDLDLALCLFLNINWRAKDESTGLPSLSKEAIRQTETFVPGYGEQRAVGALFSRLDSLIALHQREHDRLIDVRTSLMQKMFPGPGEDTPQIRFSEFSGAWRVHKLGDLVTRYDHRVLTPNDGYTRLGVRSFARGTFLEKVPADQAIGETELREVGANNLIVNIVFAWEQAIAITSEPDTVALVSHRFPQFSFNEGQCPAFYRYALLDPRFKHHLWLASPSGAGRNKTLRIDEMLDYEILVPDESEQRAIARFFKNLDQSIEARRCECDALVHAKSALLQKMFV